MAKQKILKKMNRHEMGESAAYERMEKRADKMAGRRNFANEEVENIADDRKKYYTMGKNCVGHRESCGK